MLATAPPVPAPVMSAFPVDYGQTPLDATVTGQRQFKKHKVLPRPQNERVLQVSRQRPTSNGLALDTSTSSNAASQNSSPRTLKHQPKRIGSGPELPPTPPIHSRNSSSSHSIKEPSPPAVEGRTHTPKNAPERVIATPPDQRSPPTPDVTPPQPVNRPRAVRPTLADRGISRTTTGDSRTESFRTAREEPFSSEDEDGKSTIRPALASGSTSQTTIRRISDSKMQRIPQPQALDLALASLTVSPDGTYTPKGKGKGDFGKFDGDWATPKEVEPERDDNVQKIVSARKPNPSRTSRKRSSNQPVVMEENVVAPTSAANAVRSMSLHETNQTDGLTKSSSRRDPTAASTKPPTSNSKRPQKSAGTSVRSNPSTVVEAFLVGAPPQRQRTLRHMRKQRELRDSIDISPDSTVDSFEPAPTLRPALHSTRPESRRQESMVSNSTTNSIASGRARREIVKNGGIPVVVIPDRRSSSRPQSSREPSLRSTSSRRSKRTMSVGSAPRPESLHDGQATAASGPVFERPSRRSRRFSDTDTRDERTIDYPPVIPARSSSLSAPTSRNNSRAGSMTAESLKARSAIQAENVPKLEDALPVATQQQVAPGVDSAAQANSRQPQGPMLQPSPTLHQDSLLHPHSSLERKPSHDRSSVEHQDDALSSKKYSSRNTPFSTASMETNGTAPELSEAFAVHMYPHQNSSVLMVDHSLRPSDASDITPRKQGPVKGTTDYPRITTTDPEGNEPVTPPQLQYSLEQVDSPLRNPRAPPVPPSGPPAINFTPATPSGLTPAHEKMAHTGNYFETMEENPTRRPSIVRRALARRRRHSVEYPPTSTKAPNFLTRTFSLTRNIRHGPESMDQDPVRPDTEGNATYPQAEDEPPEGDKLHPFWRPQSFGPDFDGFDDVHDYEQDYNSKRYSSVSNRSGLPKRSLSERMKRTFAIFPITDDDDYYPAGPADTPEEPDRRTIRRTPSGNLRVVRRRSSADSLKRRRSLLGRSFTSPDADAWRNLWRGQSSHRRLNKDRHRRFSVAGTFEEIQNIPRRMSERRRERRTRELRQKISGPKEVRDGVEDMLRSNSVRDRDFASGSF